MIANEAPQCKRGQKLSLDTMPKFYHCIIQKSASAPLVWVKELEGIKGWIC